MSRKGFFPEYKSKVFMNNYTTENEYFVNLIKNLEILSSQEKIFYLDYILYMRYTYYV